MVPERRERQSQGQVLEAIAFDAAVPAAVDDRRIDLTPVVAERQQSRGAGIGRNNEAVALQRDLREVARPEAFLVVDDDGVQNADAAHEIRARAEVVAQPGVLHIAVLDANDPAAVVGAGCGVRLLKHVGRHADLSIVTGRHAESEIRAIEPELVGTLAAERCMRGGVGAHAPAAEDDAGEVERRCDDGWSLPALSGERRREKGKYSSCYCEQRGSPRQHGTQIHRRWM